ncbi:MAG: flagellar hook protein FlgE [Smithellaceae bacterium]
MSSALWAGISGLNASSKQLDVIANNIANVNTIGFKGDSTFFSDVLSSSISGGSSGTLQVGRGVAVSSVQTQFGAGSFESTGNATDVAIDGDGFFMVNDAEGATYYTRAGAFHLNAEGVLVDINGYSLQGQSIDATGQPTGPLGDIILQGVQSEPAVTTTVSLGANLNSATATGGQFNTTQTVYDSLGAQHTLNTTFTRTESIGVGYWGAQVFLDSTPATALSPDGFIFDDSGNMAGYYEGAATATAGIGDLTLNRPGMVYKDTTAAISLTQTAGLWAFDVVAGVRQDGGYANATILNAAAANPQISLDGTGGADVSMVPTAATVAFTLAHTATMGQSNVDINLVGIPLEGGATIGTGNHLNWDLTSANALDITQYASSSVIRAITSDGYASGQLKTLSIDQDGIISGFFTNGQTSELAQIILASFPNPWALNKLGSNLFGETVMSGSSIRNNPGSSGMGSLTPNTLEMSNTDIATEFIRMITAQKAYQANARVVTTQDAIMSELMNIKR